MEPSIPRIETYISAENVILNAANRAIFYRVENPEGKFAPAVEAVFIALPLEVKQKVSEWRKTHWKHRVEKIKREASRAGEARLLAYVELFDFMYGLLEERGYLWRRKKEVLIGHE